MRLDESFFLAGDVDGNEGKLASPRLLRADDLDAILALQDDVMRLGPADRVRMRNAAVLGRYLDASRGLAFGIDAAPGARALDAVGLLHLPSAVMPNNEPGMPLVPVADWPLDSALLMGGMVRPARRGRGLQRLLIDCRRRAALAVGMRWVCAGVVLGQVASISNLMRSGFVITGIRDEAVGPVLALVSSASGRSVATAADRRASVGLADARSIARLLADGHAGVCVASGALQFERLIPSLTLCPGTASRFAREPESTTAQHAQTSAEHLHPRRDARSAVADRRLP